MLTAPPTSRINHDLEPDADIETPLVPHNHPALWSPCPEFDFQNPSRDPNEYAHVLARALIQHKGYGLAAPQLGHSIRAFVMMTQPSMTVCFNPEILDTGEQDDTLPEGCLSFPGIEVKVPRFTAIKARFSLPNGEGVTTTFAGLTARIFQHELEHLEGLNFTRQTTRLELELAIKKARKRGFKYFPGNFRGV